MHRHDPGEVYHVLEGEFTFYVGGHGRAVRRLTATAGDVVPLAGGTPHTVRNESDADAVAFVVHAPGAPMEDFSRAAAALAADGSPSMEAVLAVAAQHGIETARPDSGHGQGLIPRRQQPVDLGPHFGGIVVVRPVDLPSWAGRPPPVRGAPVGHGPVRRPQARVRSTVDGHRDRPRGQVRRHHPSGERARLAQLDADLDARHVVADTA